MPRQIPLEAGFYYHIYNHAVGSDSLFKSDRNYCFFLQKLTFYVHPIADIFAYCLMPNHFHLLVKMKDEGELANAWFKSKRTDYLSDEYSKLVSQQFGNLFSSYTQAFNKEQGRKGDLFISNFKRKKVRDDYYINKLMHYIHYNPVHHGFVQDLRDWKHSSYHGFLTTKTTNLRREEVIAWFGSKEALINFHQQPPDSRLIDKMEY